MGTALRRSLAAALLVATAGARAGEPDAEGCRDLPLFSRFPGYRINRCEASDFDAREFRDAQGRAVSVEGRVWMVQYARLETTTTPSRVQLHRNHENALRKVGQVSRFDDGDGQLYLRLQKDGKEIWARIDAYISDQYSVTVMEKAAMAQDVTASAEVLAAGLKATGHAAVYGIYFDTGLAVVKPESSAALGEIARLLKADAALRLHVVGHTDSVGSLESNMRLSLARGEAVAKVLSERHGIAAARLRGGGVGPLAPVASNEAEEGRARNRRVELVAQ
jgi:outer membrane protein OmpA-like peptidoglycan-associated protein